MGFGEGENFKNGLNYAFDKTAIWRQLCYQCVANVSLCILPGC